MSTVMTERERLAKLCEKWADLKGIPDFRTIASLVRGSGEGWRPISEEAPLWISHLVWCPKRGQRVGMHSMGAMLISGRDKGGRWTVDGVSHWMPLPPPPSTPRETVEK